MLIQNSARESCSLLVACVLFAVVLGPALRLVLDLRRLGLVLWASFLFFAFFAERCSVIVRVDNTIHLCISSGIFFFVAFAERFSVIVRVDNTIHLCISARGLLRRLWAIFLFVASAGASRAAEDSQGERLILFLAVDFYLLLAVWLTHILESY